VNTYTEVEESREEYQVFQSQIILIFTCEYLYRSKGEQGRISGIPELDNTNIQL